MLTPTVLYIALKQDAVPADNEHPPPEHKQRFYCATVCEPPNRCFVNHPLEACKHRSSRRGQNICGHTGTLARMDKEQKGPWRVLSASNNEWFCDKMAENQRDEGGSVNTTSIFSTQFQT